jgi:Tol biopolymer transport system component
MRRSILLLASTALAVLLVNGGVMVGEQELAQAAFPGENGKIAFVSTRDTGRVHIFSMGPDGSNQTDLNNTAGTDVAWSPDGTKIAFGNSSDIYVMNTDGFGKTNITNESTGPDTWWNGYPAWSPDGTQIAYTSFTNGNNYDIYTMYADGSIETNLTSQPNVKYPNGSDYSPAWSPDGTKIAFVSNRDSSYGQIYTMNADGTGVTRLTHNELTWAEDPAWSPDGTEIAFTRGPPSGKEEIYTMDADGANLTQLTNNQVYDGEPAWSPDGTKIAFETDRDNPGVSYQIYAMDVDGSNPTNISNNQVHDIHPDWQPANPPPPPPDTIPPNTAIDSGPLGLVNASSANFSFASSEWKSTFECSLDRATFRSCTSPLPYTGLSDGSHIFQVQATDSSGNVDATPAERTWTVDATAPVVKAPTRNLVAGSVIGNSTVPVNLTWSATDATSGVARYQLQQSINGGAFTDVALPSEKTATITPSLEAGKTYQYQVRAQDQAGNWSTWKAGPTFAVDLRQEGHQAITYTGAWTLQSSPTASGGYLKYATASGSKAKFSFAAKHVAWVTSTGSNRGKAEVWVDGVKVTTIDLYAATAQPRKMVFTKTWSTSASHRVEIRALGTKNASSSGKRVDVDAFVALR